MAGKQLSFEQQFLSDVVLAPYCPEAKERLNRYLDQAEAIVNRPPTAKISYPCRHNNCAACSGVGCWHDCHLTPAQPFEPATEVEDAEK